MSLVDGLHLNTFVAPQLLEDFRNYKDDFIGVIPGAPQGAIGSDGLRMNKLVNNVGFLVNNTAEFTAEKMLGKKGIIEWDKLDTTPTAVDDAEIRSLSFDKRAVVRLEHTKTWQIGYRDYVLRKLAPQAAAAGMPVMRTTGEDDGTGRLRMTYADLIEFYSKIGLLNLPNKDALNFQLAAVHSMDLMLDKAATNNYREGIVIDPTTGELKKFYKWKLWENNANQVYLANGTLKAAGAASVNTDRDASLFFYSDNAVAHINEVKIIYKPETIDTKSADPTSEFRLQSYALCNKKQDYGFGALVSGIKQ